MPLPAPARTGPCRPPARKEFQAEAAHSPPTAEPAMRPPGLLDRKAAPPGPVSASRTSAAAVRLNGTSAALAARLPARPAAPSSFSPQPLRPRGPAAPGACAPQRPPGQPAAAPAHYPASAAGPAAAPRAAAPRRCAPAGPAHAAARTTTTSSAPSKPPPFTTAKAGHSGKCIERCESWSVSVRVQTPVAHRSRCSSCTVRSASARMPRRVPLATSRPG
jgi:hypothetical protein